MSLDKVFLGKRCIFRTYSAGVHYGTLSEREGTECLVLNAIRIWRWEGAFTLSQLAMGGTKKPSNCKFAMPVAEILLTEVIEIIPCSEQAIDAIEGVKTFEV